MEEPPEKRNPPAVLTDELLVEILRRVPVRSLCRFKCVSRSWRYLISDSVHRKKWVMLPDGSWASGEARTARLGFDSAVSSHFHVFEYVVDDEQCVTGVEIYSSRTGAWSFKENEWGDDVMLCDSARSVFLNGFMHMISVAAGIVMVDVEGKTWRSIPVPSEVFLEDGCIDQTQGRLLFLKANETDPSKLSIWILEDHGTHEWTLKHSVRKLFLFRKNNLRFSWDYTLIKVHPECNLIYFVYGRYATLVAYEMDREEVRVIRNLGRESADFSSFLPYVPLFSEALADEQ